MYNVSVIKIIIQVVLLFLLIFNICTFRFKKIVMFYYTILFITNMHICFRYKWLISENFFFYLTDGKRLPKLMDCLEHQKNHASPLSIQDIPRGSSYVIYQHLLTTVLFDYDLLQSWGIAPIGMLNIYIFPASL